VPGKKEKTAKYKSIKVTQNKIIQKIFLSGKKCRAGLSYFPTLSYFIEALFAFKFVFL